MNTVHPQAEMAERSHVEVKRFKAKQPFRVSLRYKLAFPVTVLMIMMAGLLLYTTFNLVRSAVMDGIEDRLRTISEVYTAALKVPIVLGEKDSLNSVLDWISSQSNVAEVLVADQEGKEIVHIDLAAEIHPDMLASDFVGIRRVGTDEYLVVTPIQEDQKILGRVIILFSNLGIEKRLKEIFKERALVGFVMVLTLSLMTSLVAWVVIQPLFVLEQVAKRILTGDLDARAVIHSFDEIEDLSDAFNEMVSRLSKSLDRLRSRTEALEESEEKYRLIVENASDIIFTITAEGEIVLLNRGFSGHPRDQFLREGLPLVLSLHTEESKKLFQHALEDLMRTKKSVNNVSVTHVIEENKSEIFYLVNLTPVLGHFGEVKLIQAVMRDITELKQVEVMKESLVRDVAHELKTPVAKFEMAVNWFEKEIETKQHLEGYREIVLILKNNIDRLMHTINSIMDLSKLESGMQNITKTELDLNQVLKDLFQDMCPMVERKNLKFELSLSSKPLPMNGDGHMLYRLFCNLVQNAIKFTELGQISVKSKLVGDEIHVEVHDTGNGIEEQDLETIFERFVQKTAASTGIGVGLTICRDIAALHQGRIWATSPGLGKGSTFHAVFPLL